MLRLQNRKHAKIDRLMNQRSNKKRKLNSNASEENSTAEQEYNYKPIRLRTVETDLEAIPRDILIRALIHHSKCDIAFFQDFNESLQLAATHPGPLPTPYYSHISYDKLIDPATSSEYELHQFSPWKIRDHVVKLFAQHPYHKPYRGYNPYDNEEEEDRREINYNKLVKELEKLMEHAQHLSHAGENASAFLILKIMQDIATEGKFESNGDIHREDDDDEDEESLALYMTPEVFINELTYNVDLVREKLSDQETAYCAQKLLELHVTLPNSENNQEAFDAFPLTSDRVSTLFDHKSYGRSHEYVGKFTDIVSSIHIQNDQKIYEVHARTAAVSMSGHYIQKIVFTTQTINEYTCSCPMSLCKHMAALMTQICSQKTQQQAHYNIPQYNQYQPTASYYHQ